MGPEDLARLWPLSGVSMGSVAQTSPGRRVIRVDSDQGVFAAKIDDTTTQHGDGPEVLEVLAYLNRAEFPHAPTLLRTRSDSTVARVGTSTVTVMEFVPRRVVEAGQPRALGWSQLGQAAARLNKYGDYRHPFAIPVDRAVKELAERAKGHPFEQAFLDVLLRLPPLAEAQQTSLIHGELNEANALRRADGTIVFVDWDQAGTGLTVLEYGYPLITNFISEQDHEFDASTARAFYDGYRVAGGSIDRGQLFIAALFHALRYMWWGDTLQRWARIRFAIEHEDELLDQIS